MQRWFNHDPPTRKMNFFVCLLLRVDVFQFSRPVCGRFRFRQRAHRDLVAIATKCTLSLRMVQLL